MAKSSIFWLFSGPVWPLKVAVAVFIPIALAVSMAAAFPWAVFFLLLPVATLLAGKPLIAAQQILLIIALPSLFAYLQQVVSILFAAIALQRLPEFDLWYITAHIPGHLLHYAASGADPLQWAGRATALFGFLAALKLLPWSFAGSLLSRKKLQFADDAALGTARWSGWGDLRGVAKPGWPKLGSNPAVVVGKLDNKIVSLYPHPPKIFNRHVLVVGASGSGKSTGFVLPNVFAAAQSGQSIVITDPKAELVTKTGAWLEKQGYTVQIFAPGQNIGQVWNPLLAVRNETEVDLLAAALLQNQLGTGGSDVFFRAAEEYLLRLFLHAVRVHPALKDSERNLLTVLEKLERLDEKALAAFVASSGSQIAMDTLQAYQAKIGKHDPALGVVAKLSALRKAAVNLCPAGGNDIDLAAIRQQKTALFCVLPVGSNNLAGLLAAFYALLFARLLTEEDIDTDAPHGVRFLLDEFANLGAIPGFSQYLAVARGFGVDICIMLQGIDQLDSLYGQSEARTIVNNCAVQLALGANDLTSSVYFSRQLGETAVRQRRERHIQDNLISRHERSEDSIRRSLMTSDEVRRMAGQSEGLLIAGAHTVRFKRLDFYAEKLYKEMSRQPFVLPPIVDLSTNDRKDSPPNPPPVDDGDDTWF